MNKEKNKNDCFLYIELFTFRVSRKSQKRDKNDKIDSWITGKDWIDIIRIDIIQFFT